MSAHTDARLGSAVCIWVMLRTHAQSRIPSPARGSWVLCAQNCDAQIRGKDAVRKRLRTPPLPRPFPAPACGSNSYTMESPISFVRGTRPAGERQPCLLDALALRALHVTSTKLHKKTIIALTKWRVWNPATTTWLTKSVVRLQMFAADKAMDYRDTRIQHQGRLMDWKTYTELRRQ